MNNITIDEAMQKYPFIKDIQNERVYISLEVKLSELDQFLSQSLIEENSEALGHFNVKKYLYIARGDKLHSVDVKRLTRKIYPPEYLRPGMYFPTDEEGWSETASEALSRQDLTEAQYIVLYTFGSDGYTKNTNQILIAPVKTI